MQSQEVFNLIYETAKAGKEEELTHLLHSGKSPNITILKEIIQGIFVPLDPVALLAFKGEFRAVELLLELTNKLTTHEEDYTYKLTMYNAIFGYALGQHTRKVNELISLPPHIIKKRIEAAIKGYAIVGNKEQVKELQNIKVEDPNILKNAAVVCYALGGHIDCVDELIAQGASKRSAFRGYAIAGVKTINELLEMGAQKEDLIRAMH